MRSRSTVTLVAVAIGGGLAVSAAFLVAPAGAIPGQAPTAAEFQVEAGTLNISVPDSVDLGSTALGSTLTAQLGNVTVSDTRGLLDASWTVEVGSTDFTTGGGTAPETVGAIFVDYWSGPALSTTGVGTFIPGQAESTDAAPLSDPVTAFTHTGGSGENSATWNPTLEIEVPGFNVAGAYSGTITHSVA